MMTHNDRIAAGRLSPKSRLLAREPRRDWWLERDRAEQQVAAIVRSEAESHYFRRATRDFRRARRAVGVGTIAEIRRFINHLASEGLGVVVISSCRR
jgi:hypothetical protein